MGAMGITGPAGIQGPKGTGFGRDEYGRYLVDHDLIPKRTYFRDETTGNIINVGGTGATGSSNPDNQLNLLLQLFWARKR